MISIRSECRANKCTTVPRGNKNRMKMKISQIQAKMWAWQSFEVGEYLT